MLRDWLNVRQNTDLDTDVTRVFCPGSTGVSPNLSDLLGGEAG